MREILFRGKDSDGVWHYSMTIARAATTDGEISHIYFGSCPTCSVPAETVGQYTGLTDKNGTKIFEGDIFVDKEDEVVSVVEFRNGMFCLVDYGIRGASMEYGYDESAGGFGECDCQPMDNYYADEMIIDGNIHDNPELLEAREKE